MSRTRSALRAARTLVVVGAVAALALATGGPAQASGKTSNGGDSRSPSTDASTTRRPASRSPSSR